VTAEPTRTDPTSAAEWRLNDVVVQLREWGSGRTYPLPTATSGEWLVGAAQACTVRLEDARHLVSRRHARLVREQTTWTLTDNGSKNGLWLDDARRPSFVLAPGIEVGIGGLRLVAESHRLDRQLPELAADTIREDGIFAEVRGNRALGETDHPRASERQASRVG
jgi:predicted component of type VI protein secretion system